VTFASAALMALLAQALPPEPSPHVFEVSVERIRVDVLVTRGGQPVRGLTAADFELRDCGVVQQLQPVLSEAEPVDTLLVLDRSGSVSGSRLAALREAASAFLDQLRGGERAALLAFSAEVALAQPLTAELQRVRAAVDRGAAGGSTSLRDAIYASLRLSEPGARRTVVVVFSDGVDTASWLRPAQVVSAARRCDATVYGVLAGDPDERDDSVLREVSRATGGRLFESRRLPELRTRFLEVLEDVRNRYVLSYAPQGVERGGWHPLSVRLKRGRGEVLARPGYWRQLASQP